MKTYSADGVVIHDQRTHGGHVQHWLRTCVDVHPNLADSQSQLAASWTAFAGQHGVRVSGRPFDDLWPALMARGVRRRSNADHDPQWIGAAVRHGGVS